MSEETLSTVKRYQAYFTTWSTEYEEYVFFRPLTGLDGLEGVEGWDTLSEFDEWLENEKFDKGIVSNFVISDTWSHFTAHVIQGEPNYELEELIEIEPLFTAP